MIDDHLLGRLPHPLEQGEVAELIGAEDLEHLHGLISDVLNEVAVITRHNANVARHIIESAGSAFGGEDGYASAAFQEEGPLISVGVPVHLPDRARLNRDMGGGHGLGDLEVLGVGYAHFSPARLLGLLLHHAVGEVVLGLLHALASWSLLVDRARIGALENVLLTLGDVGEDLGRQIEVLGDDGLGRVSYCESVMYIIIKNSWG